MSVSQREGSDGLFSLSSRNVSLCEEVDRRVVEWARSLGSHPERNSELLRRCDLDRISYFDSFPHLAHRVTPELESDGEEEHFLTSAACYGAYFARLSSELPDRELVTVLATCRRREADYEPLRRQREFQMREVVAIGDPAWVEDLLEQGAEFAQGLAAAYGIDANLAVATDPFFSKDDPRIAYQRMFPTKRELVDDSRLAIASINLHRTFFGERCEIALAGGTPASSGCVAFGLERWVDALLRAPGCPA
jgi:hypothetical protein